ncbi:MAG TPA: DNA recombination protein RmuC [Terriglobales bacterium]|nr:DNA recombination protein RmuC [Terriglobales bacterium]
MNGALIVALLALAALVAWVALQALSSQKKSGALENQMNELRRDVQTIASAQSQNTGQISTFATTVTQRLDAVSKSLQDGVANSAQIASQGQSAIAGELKNTQGMMERIHKQLGEFQELGRGLNETQQSLEAVLGGAKTRGLLGEVTLEHLLADSLPPTQYAIQYRFTSGEIVDAAIFLRDRKLLAVDSKFPLDAFRRIETERDDARRAFGLAVKGHADAIAKKYIVPNENTLELALMFVPSESVYYELLMTKDSKGELLDAYCRAKNVIAVSPNTLYAHLCVIAMGLRGMQIEENAKDLQAGLAGLQRQFDTFSDIFQKLGTHLKNAQQNYADADKRLEKAQMTLGSMLRSGETSAELADDQGKLALPPEAAAKQSR